MAKSLAAVSLIILVPILAAEVVWSQEPDERPGVFSGPQPGERLPALPVRLVYSDDTGEVVDLVEQAGGEPMVLVFVHQVSRPSIMVTRLLARYADSRAEDRLHTGVVWLEDDLSAAEQMLNRIRHAMTDTVPTGISVDGQEGPGSYGLNRNVSLTILVAKDNQVTANFALVQPSVQADLPKILKAVVDQVGGEVPRLTDLAPEVAAAAMMRRAEPSPRLRQILRRLIDKSASDEQVDRVARAIQNRMDEDRQVAGEVHAIARRIVRSGNLENYGTRRAQRYLRTWAHNADRNTDDQADQTDRPSEGQRAADAPPEDGPSDSGDAEPDHEE